MTTTPQTADRRTARRGFTLTELMVVTTLIGVMAAMSVPSFQRAVEQSRVDIAVANLRAVWAAERLYWLEHRAYAPDLTSLQAFGLLDPAVVTTTLGYVYAVQAAAENTFTAAATRAGSNAWTGALVVDDSGALSGLVSALGEPMIVPGFQ